MLCSEQNFFKHLSFIVCKMLSFSVEGAGGPLLEEGASPAVPGGCMMGQQCGYDDI